MLSEVPRPPEWSDGRPEAGQCEDMSAPQKGLFWTNSVAQNLLAEMFCGAVPPQDWLAR